MDRLEVVALRHGPLWNFTYLLACLESGEAAVIDPAWDVAGILDAARARDLGIKKVLLTHSHSDHVNGARELAEASGARVFAHHAEAGDLRPVLGGDLNTLSTDDVLEVGSIPLRTLHTPGHTAGSVSFLAGGRLFVGDTLNVGSPGTPGPEAGSLEALWRSTLEVLGCLPDETVIHPGHDSGPSPESLLGSEKRGNPALRAQSLEEFVVAVERATGRRHRD